MNYDLYPILIKELMSMYNMNDDNINTLYTYLYIRCSIVNERKLVCRDDIIKFILDELNISIFTNDEEGNSTIPYVVYNDSIYNNFEWTNDFIDNLEFRANFEGDLTVQKTLEKVYLKGYRKSVKYKNVKEYKDYIKYNRLLVLNEMFNVELEYPMSIDGFKEAVNHNPYKRGLEESLKLKLDVGKALYTNTTTHISEKQLETFIIQDLNIIEYGMVFMERQVDIEGGIIDILAKDKFGNICIIEVKINEDKSLIWQAMHYPKEIKKRYRHLNIRMITVAPSYSKHILDALKDLNNIEILEYQIKVSSDNIDSLSISKRH